MKLSLETGSGKPAHRPPLLYPLRSLPWLLRRQGTSGASPTLDTQWSYCAWAFPGAAYYLGLVGPSLPPSLPESLQMHPSLPTNSFLVHLSLCCSHLMIPELCPQIRTQPGCKGLPPFPFQDHTQLPQGQPRAQVTKSTPPQGHSACNAGI